MKAFGDFALSVFVSLIIFAGILLIVQKFLAATFLAATSSVFFSLLVPASFVLARRQIRLSRVNAASVFRDTFDSFLSSQTYFEFLARKYSDNNASMPGMAFASKQKHSFLPVNQSEWLLIGSSIPYVTLSAFGFLSVLMPFKDLARLFYNTSNGAVPGSFLSETGQASFEVAITLSSLAFVSAFLYSLRLFLKGIIAYNLSAITMLRAFAHMFFAIMLAVLIWKIAPASGPLNTVTDAVQNTLTSDSKVTVRSVRQDGVQDTVAPSGGAERVPKIWLIMAFALGFVPDAAFSWFLQRTRLALNRRDRRAAKHMAVIPLTIIDGIDFLTAFRLEEGRIASVQNLAAANPVMLHVETSYCIFVIMDWIAQAQLCAAVGPDRFLLFRKMNVRTILDLDQCVLHPASPPGLKQIAGSVLLATSPVKPSLLRDFGVRPLDLANRDFDKAMASWVNIEVIEQLVRVIMESLHIQRFRQLWRDLEGSIALSKPERLPRPGPRLAASNVGSRDPHPVEIAAASKPSAREMQTEIHGE